MKVLLYFLIRSYQKFVSPMFPASCRYRPTCSEYAIWQLKFNPVLVAIFYIFKRILKCNQYFSGGFDYPIIRRNFSPKSGFFLVKKLNIKFWFIKNKKKRYFVIKVINFEKEK